MALGFLAWGWFGVGRLDANATRALAVTEDFSHVAAELLLIVASFVDLSGKGR